MKKATLTLLLLTLVNTSFAQVETCDCKSDLDFIVEKMKKMPSYKKQIKGQKLADFNATYQSSSDKMLQPISIESCYKLLLKQMLLVKDIHTNLSINTKSDATSNNNHPKTDRDTIALKERLSNKSINDLEGIYNLGTSQKIGIYYDTNKKDLIGVVLKNSLSNWEIGDISFYAYHVDGPKYNVYRYHQDTKIPRLTKSITFENGRLISYKKEGNTLNFEFVEENQSELEFKQLTNDTQYLYFGNFSNSKKAKHLSFFKDTKDKITAKNVIVDLRSNSGGNKKYSDSFLKLLKNKNIYIITNCYTASNGEQFTVKLKNLKNATHLGQATYGAIAYGINYGRSYKTPTANFTITPTDMNFQEYFEYEAKGVAPDKTLDFDKDWIQQTLDLIASKNN